MSLPIVDRTMAAAVDRVAEQLEDLPAAQRPDLDSPNLRRLERELRLRSAAGDKDAALLAVTRWGRAARAELELARGDGQ